MITELQLAQFGKVMDELTGVMHTLNGNLTSVSYILANLHTAIPDMKPGDVPNVQRILTNVRKIVDGIEEFQDSAISTITEVRNGLTL